MKLSRKTKSLEVLLNIFEQNKKAVSVVALVEELKEQMNKTTVYRILDKLERDGIVHSFLGKGGLKWFAKCQGCSSDHHNDVHPHFQCQECGKVSCLSLEIAIPPVPNMQIESVHILLMGKCADCSV